MSRRSLGPEFRNLLVASQSILPGIVANDHLAAANGRLAIAEILTNQITGPLLGGVLFAAAAEVPFAVDAASLREYEATRSSAPTTP